MADEIIPRKLNLSGQMQQPVGPRKLNLSGVSPVEQPVGPRKLKLSQDWGAGPEVPTGVARDVQYLEQKKAKLGRGLTKDEFLQDPELMRMIRDNMASRYADSNIIHQSATAIAGGATAPRGWESMSDEDIFEAWQNYHRSFAGGQTVTTMNEVGYAAVADQEKKLKLGLGYKLFESMDNAIVGEGTWSETFDAVGDYMSAAIWDPTTVLSLGVGRAFTAGGAKAASTALRETAGAMVKAELKKQLAAGVSKEIAEQTAKAVGQQFLQKAFADLGAKTAKKAALYMGGVDMATAIGTDVLYQDTLIKTQAQDEYSIPQTALAALGVVVTPALVEAGKLGAKGLEQIAKTFDSKIFEQYKGIKYDIAGKDFTVATELMKNRIDLTQVNSKMRSGLERFKANMDNMKSWPDAKDTAIDILDQSGSTPSLNRHQTNFFKLFMYGNDEQEGLFQELARSGFVFAKRDENDNITNWLGDALSWLDDDIIESSVKAYEEATGINLPFKPTAEDMAAAYKVSASDAGYALALQSKLKSMIGEITDKKGVTSQDEELLSVYTQVTKELKEAEELAPDRAGWFQSIWKRLVTSHPATTGLNVTGWATMSLMNSASDLVLGALNMGEGVVRAGMGDIAGAKFAMQKGKGTLLGSLKRGYNLMNFNATLDEFNALAEANPDLLEELFRQGAGDTGTLNALGDFNMPSTRINQAVEKGVSKVQALTGVVLQDEVTKALSFMSAFDRAIMRQYGVDYNTFMQRPDLHIEMASPKFITNVLNPALDRTLRETVSKTWTTKPGRTVMLHLAKEMERFSNNSVTGYAIPFGRFFNTSMSVIGDFTGLNYVRHLMKKASGKTVDAAQDEGQELLAKGLVGISALLYFGSQAQNKIDQGLAWNQERREDGSIEDTTYDFPESFFRLTGQLVGHWMKDGEIPDDLAQTYLTQTLGQTFRATDEGIKAVSELMTAIVSADVEQSSKLAAESFLTFMSGIVSGATRPLDPVNQAAMMMTEDYAVPDRRQGYEFWNKSLRYVDKIFNFTELPDRAFPTRGTQVTPDTGRMLGGVRSTPENNEIESMLNSIGKESWKAVRWDGEAAVKNRMDELVAPILNAYARRELARNPDFFKLPLGERKFIVEEKILKPAKEATRALLESSIGQDETLNIMGKLAQKPQKDVRKALDYVAPGKELSDLAAMTGGKAKLETLLYMVENWDKIMYDK